MFRCGYCGDRFEEPILRKCKPYRIRQGGLILDECDSKELCPSCESDDLYYFNEDEEDEEEC
jgi:hypothetical protein